MDEEVTLLFPTVSNAGSFTRWVQNLFSKQMWSLLIGD